MKSKAATVREEETGFLTKLYRWMLLSVFWLGGGCLLISVATCGCHREGGEVKSVHPSGSRLYFTDGHRWQGVSQAVFDHVEPGDELQRTSVPFGYSVNGESFNALGSILKNVGFVAAFGAFSGLVFCYLAPLFNWLEGKDLKAKRSPDLD